MSKQNNKSVKDTKNKGESIMEESKESFLGKLSWLFAKKYRVTLMIWLIVGIFGLLSYTTLLKREGFPPVNLPLAITQGTYFVDDADKIDAEITQPLAKAIETVDGVDTYEATSGSNFYNILITFEETVDPEDGASEVEAAINDQVVLPQGVENNVAAIDPTKFDDQYNLIVAVYEEQDSDYTTLAQKAELVASELSGASAIDSAEAVPVLEDTTNPDGSVSERQTVINKIALREDGETVFYPAVNVGVIKIDGVDDIELSEAVQETLSSVVEKGELNGVQATITADQAGQIDEQIGTLESSLTTGLIAVLIVALLLISWRAALVIALFIPTVLAGVFLGLNALGLTLNTITLFATILTLGLFVDDATIIVEAIDAHRKDKAKHKDIIKSAVGRVGMASVAGTLTTILVFMPMLFVSGILGSFIRLLPITVILALVVSLTVALLIVPFIARPLVLGTGNGKLAFLDRLSFLLPVERYLGDKLSKLPLINRDNKRKGRIITTVMVGISILAVIGSGLLASRLPLEIFPESKDSNLIAATVEFAPNTTIEEAEAITDELDSRISSAVGSELHHITYVTADERSAIIEVGLTSYTEREPTSHDIVADLEATGLTIDDATVKYGQADVGPPAEDFPFQMRVYAIDEDVLASAAQEIAGFIGEQSLDISGDTVGIAEVKTDQGNGINRTERGQFATISASFTSEDSASGAVIALQDKVTQNYDEEKLINLGLNKDALDLDVSQESENAESFGSMGIGLIIAIAAMYLLLLVLFDSFSQPLLILLAVPFSLFGVFFGLTVTDNALSFFVMLGLLGLVGISVNNSILLTEYANQEKRAGADRYTAISNAMRIRFRPLATTTLTTVFALLPIALNDPFWQSLAYTLMFGLLSSTILIVISFPYYYLGLERLREWKNRRFPGLE